MTNLHLNALQERLRPIARLVFPSDPLRSVNLSSMNRYTCLYLRRIIQRAADDPFNLTITNKQLARLFHTQYKKFLEWFCHGIKHSKVFRRVRRFIKEIILMNIHEDLGNRDILHDRYVPERPIDQPSRRTMAYWQDLIRCMREQYQNREPVIESLSDAAAAIGWWQSAYSLSDSSESDSESVGCEGPEENRFVDEVDSDMVESRGLNGPSIVLNPDQLLEPFKNLLLQSDNGCNDDDTSSSADYDQSDQPLCLESARSKPNE